MENNSSAADDVVSAVRAEQTGRPRRKAAKKVANLFPDDDSEPEVEVDSDVENNKEYTEKDALPDAGKKSLDEDSCEEDCDDEDIAALDQISKPSKKSKKKDPAAKPLQYAPPADIAEFCQEYREKCLEDMKEELENFVEDYGEFEWTPTDEDFEEIERTVLSRLLFNR